MYIFFERENGVYKGGKMHIFCILLWKCSKCNKEGMSIEFFLTLFIYNMAFPVFLYYIGSSSLIIRFQ